MKTIILSIIFLIAANFVKAQQKIRVDPMMLMQLRIPIQPGDKALAHWNFMKSIQDSTKTIRIDRKVQGIAPFFPIENAPYYSAIQIKEIQIYLEKILNPDSYFSGREDYMKYYQEFLVKFVSINKTDHK